MRRKPFVHFSGALLSVAFLAPPAAPAPAFPEHGRLLRENVNYLARFDPGADRASGLWGYTAPDGREYALLGVQSGVSVINITNRKRPYQVRLIPGSRSMWREIKTYGHYAYAVNEGGGGLAVIDLADPENPVSAGTFTAFVTAHNLYIDEKTALAFIAGSDRDYGVRILSLADPRRPVQIGFMLQPYAHDVYARGSRMYVSAIREPALLIVDISNPRSPTEIGRIADYRDAFTHNAWLTEDGTHVMTTDEISGARCRLWDIRDLSRQIQTDVYAPLSAPRAIPHNVLIDGPLAFISYYTAGVRVVDVSNPQDLVEVGFFDTVPTHNFGVFEGAWGVFPFYPNSPELFVVSDIFKGLFVLELEEAPGAPDLEFPAARAEAEAPRPELGLPSPSPFRAGTETSLELFPAGSKSRPARVFDAAGRLVRVLEASGSERIAWDGRAASGVLVSPGVYFISVELDSGRLVRRVCVLRD
jgi:choice-of-anchor B domain-containing protein